MYTITNTTQQNQKYVVLLNVYLVVAVPEFLHCGHGGDVELVLAPRQVPLPSRVPPAPMLKSSKDGDKRLRRC